MATYDYHAAMKRRLDTISQMTPFIPPTTLSQLQFQKSQSPNDSSFDNFKSAISGQESGGSYKAVNKSSGALGKYQIMPANLGGTRSGWDYEALGKDITPQQFLSTPQIQEQIASYKLREYYNKYGPAGAAVAWYAGPGAVSRANSNTSQGAYPSINAYKNSILRRMGLQ